MQEREEEREEERQEREEERLDRRHRVAREEALQDAIDARLHEDERAMQQMAQVAAFNTAFLQTFSQMVQAFGHRNPVLCRDPAIQGLTL